MTVLDWPVLDWPVLDCPVLARCPARRSAAGVAESTAPASAAARSALAAAAGSLAMLLLALGIRLALGVGDEAVGGVVEAGVVLAGDHRADRLLDVAKLIVLFGREQRERRAALSRTSRPADAVDVVLGHVRQVEVDDVGDAVDVDAAGNDVGGDEYLVLAALEAVERLLALRLRAVAVDGRPADAVLARAPARRDPRGASCG